MEVALVHDYLTQRGGAERVVLSMARAFPGSPLFTSLYEPEGTFPEFASLDIHTLPIDRIGFLRRHHRAALPLLAPAFSSLRVDADVVVCSSSGWAHGTRVAGRKVVYCHTPARWLYQSDRYLRGRATPIQGAAAAIGLPLRRWDRAAAASADLYVANSAVVAKRVAEEYGIEAEVLSPPPALGPDGPVEPITHLDGDFVLCVSRLLPYKNLDRVVRAFSGLPDQRLVIAGEGPEAASLQDLAGTNVTLVGRVTDAQLRWLYSRCVALVAASYEDFGLTPLEAAGFGKPTAALRFGGFLETVDEGVSGLFFDEPTPEAIAEVVRTLLASSWDVEAIRELAARFGEDRFIERLRALAVPPSP